MATIYKIEVGEYIYYGSTKQRLCQRQDRHNESLRNGKKNYKIYQKCRELNINKIKCIEIEKCKLEERNTREGYYIRICNKDILLNCVIPDRYRIGNDKYDEEYYENNKDKIKERKSVIIICECGSRIQKGKISRHKKSIKHINYLL